jgi:HTH-type transcriptional regulator / antitoxin HipB
MGTSDLGESGAVNDTFADAVRLRRRQLGLRQDELADLAGVSERFLYALENGKRSVQLDKVVAVLSALGLHLELHLGADAEIKPHTERWLDDTARRQSP